MVWTIHLCGHLSGRAYTYLHGQCNVDGCLGKRGYESTPVCAKPSYWMRRDDSEFIHEFTWKWTASLNRFVLDKSHPRMRYDMWISTFSGSLHSA